MAHSPGETSRSSIWDRKRPMSQLMGRFESLPGWVAATVIVALFAATFAFPDIDRLDAIVTLWLFVPVVLAAIRFRSPGALVAAVGALLLAGPLATWHPGPLLANGLAEWIVASLAFLAMGQFVALAVHQPPGARRRELLEARADRALSRALDRQQLAVHYQPIMAIGGPKAYFASAEALLRWRDPAAHSESPTALVAPAEHSDVMRDLSEFVLRQACARIAEWSLLLSRPFIIWVNFSASELSDDTLPARIRAAIDRAGIDPSQLGVEITESAAMSNVRHSVELLEQIHALGVALSIDDFGTGRSSLEYIQLLPVDVIKIDGSFIKELGNDPIPTKLVATIIDLAHAMGLQAVAEHVETDEQLASLQQLGCDYAQGFLFSRAVAPSVVRAWMHGRHAAEQRSRPAAGPAAPLPAPRAA